MKSILYDVPGIDEEAGDLLKKRLQKLFGVQDVTVWLGEQEINVYYDPTVISPQALLRAIRDLGYWPKPIPRMQRRLG